MGGLVKHLFWVAPLAVVLIIITWVINRETTIDIRTQDAAFERDWNESMAGMSRDRQQADKYQVRAVEAQSRLSSAQQEQTAKHQQMRAQDQSIDKAVEDLNQQLEGGGAVK